MFLPILARRTSDSPTAPQVKKERVALGKFQAELDAAIAAENYELAAVVRDHLGQVDARDPAVLADADADGGGLQAADAVVEHLLRDGEWFARIARALAADAAQQSTL
mgnify:CR=1 FL=1